MSSGIVPEPDCTNGVYFKMKNIVLATLIAFAATTAIANETEKKVEETTTTVETTTAPEEAK